MRSLAINGGTEVFVVNGDVGSNANMTYSGSGSMLHLDSGYRMDYYDDTGNPPLWGGRPATHIFAVVPDPAYPVPTRGLTPPAGGVDATGCDVIAASILANPNYAPSVPVAAGVPDMAESPVIARACTAVNSGNNGTLAILKPGLYFFDGGLDAQGSVIGGYTPGSEGVALVFPESQGTMFKNRSGGGGSSLTQVVSLNAGTRYLNSAGQEATPARDYSGALVQTNTTPSKMMTVIVPPDPRCPVVDPFPASCSNMVENQNKAIDLSGGSGLYLAGVQYAPSDNITVAGNTTTGGYIGQIWAWTIVYTGGSDDQPGRVAERRARGLFGSMPPALHRGRPACHEDRELGPFWLAGVVGLPDSIRGPAIEDWRWSTATKADAGGPSDRAPYANDEAPRRARAAAADHRVPRLAPFRAMQPGNVSRESEKRSAEHPLMSAPSARGNP